MILIVSYPGEEHTASVVQHLQAMGRECLQVDLADLPAGLPLALNWAADGPPRLCVDGTDVMAARVGWWRRVRPHTIDTAVTNPEMRAFAESETAHAVGGMLDSLPCRWVNGRAADEAAHRKPYQWTVAQACGLEIPRTLVTTDPAQARAFVETAGPDGAIFKPFLASSPSWRETRLVRSEDLDRLELVRIAPVIFQDYIPGVDLRVTVVGDRIFAAEIDARHTAYPYDMRMMIGEAAIRAVTLPDDVASGLLRLQRQLGLDYGAIDLRRTEDGRHVFLEVNPAGQWLFTEERAGLPISRAMADFLAGLDRFDRPTIN